MFDRQKAGIGLVDAAPPSLHPELDLPGGTDAYLADASPDAIAAKMASGYRLFRLKRTLKTPSAFTALFVRNDGPFRLLGNAVHYDCSKEDVQKLYADNLHRIVDVCPYVVDTPRFAVVTVSNKGAQAEEYAIVLDATSFEQLSNAIDAGRVIDLDAYVVADPVNGSQRYFAGVVVKRANGDSRTQTLIVASTADVYGAMFGSSNSGPDGRNDARVLAFDTVPNSAQPDSPDGDAFYCVLETGGHIGSWWFAGLADDPFESDPDGFVHVQTRLNARFCELRQLSSGRYGAALIGSEPPVQGYGDGANDPVFARLDALAVKTLRDYELPGLSLGVVKDGRLAYAKAFGYADVAKRIPAGPATPFPIGSITKTLTATALHRLMQDNTTFKSIHGDIRKLTLDTNPFLDIFPPGAEAPPMIHGSLKQITVRHLMEHRSGLWGDVQTQQYLASGAPLEAAPGTAEVYKSANYCVLGDMVNRVLTGTFDIPAWPYGSHEYNPTRSALTQYIQQSLLQPLGITRMVHRRHDLAPAFAAVCSNTITSGALDSEFFHAPEDYQTGAYGSWYAALPDLLRFYCAIDGSRPGVRLLSSDTFKTIATESDGFRDLHGKAPSDWFFGLGWHIWPEPADPAGMAWSHAGDLPGWARAWAMLGLPTGTGIRSDIKYVYAVNGDGPARNAPKRSPWPSDAPVQNPIDIDSFLPAAIEGILRDWKPTSVEDFFPKFGFPKV